MGSPPAGRARPADAGHDPVVDTEITLRVDGAQTALTVDTRTSLLDALRERLGNTSAKKGCDHGQCGACTVHIDGQAMRSCSLPVSAVSEDQKIVTIEGLAPDGNHPVQVAWRALDVPQCGFCQSGMIMAAAALLAEKPKPTDEDINEAITNICRCGTFNRVRAGIHQAAAAGITG